MIIAITGKNLPISSARLKKTAAQTKFDTVRVSEWDHHPEWTTEQGLINMVNWYKETRK